MSADIILVAAIDEHVKYHGSIRNAAKYLGIDHAYLHKLRTGKKNNPSESVLQKLRLKRLIVITYQKVKP